ncbi:OLC1v1015707C1 [Oldenlandia corymbosa var. corymbosa]|uniref:OLC1v1015707C1 n=1 Tax=Oldenlandia corymbosa var. corymbosa TaxID=529605 RepID=A0AAV1E3Y0_OLDCO|nr:OLC1v1015707C1 [Oldenlandia corymbosa var. corymbosa]
MGKSGCTSDGSVDVSKFNEPMPRVGLYIAGASAACAIGMAVDAIHGIRYRKFWFPSKFFTLNATTLTLVAVATKLSVDLNTSMPRPQDQLPKLSSTVLVCTMMASFKSSLGTTTDNNELLANLVALGIFVVTVMVNICIELGTGVIYIFCREYAVILVVMFTMLALKISSALTIPPTKKFFEIKSKEKLQLAKNECNDEMNQNSNNASREVCDKLKKDLTKYWMMAHTCDTQFVLARLTTCSASGAFCLISTSTLTEAAIRCYFFPRQFKFCGGESYYNWSIMPILITQSMAIGMGTLAPASRYFATINFVDDQRPVRTRREPAKLKDAIRY